MLKAYQIDAVNIDKNTQVKRYKVYDFSFCPLYIGNINYTTITQVDTSFFPL